VPVRDGDENKPDRMRLKARVQEPHDSDGDLVWAVLIAAMTYDWRGLDWLADTLDGELEFVPTGRWS
jgi:hypothetical protein